MSDGHDGGGHDGGVDHSGHAGHGAHGAFGSDHGGAFGHSFDLGHLAAGLGSGFSAPHGHSHGHGHGHSVGHAPGPASGNGGGWAFGYVGHALAQMGVVDRSTCGETLCDAEAGVRLPGVLILESNNAIQLLVWPHGKTNPQAVLTRIAARNGLVSLSRRVRGVVANNKNHETLLDTKVFDGPGKRSQASASYPGATGSTTVWNEFWQLPVKKNWWSSPDIQVGPPLPSHIIITGYTWYFNETGDYESRIAFSVSNPKTCIAGQWLPINEDAQRSQMIVAKRVAIELFEELTKVKPSEYSVLMRQMQDSAAPGLHLRPETSATIADSHGGPGPGPVPASVRSVEPMKFDMAGGA